MTMPLSGERIAARLKIVEEHVRLENRHDLDGIMGTFGGAAQYELPTGRSLTRAG
jgi:hypothetical protein